MSEVNKYCIVTSDKWPVPDKTICVYEVTSTEDKYVPTFTLFRALGKQKIPDKYLQELPKGVTLDKRIIYALNMRDIKACMEDVLHDSEYVDDIGHLLKELNRTIRKEQKKRPEREEKKEDFWGRLREELKSFVSQEARIIALQDIQESPEFPEMKRRKCDEVLEAFGVQLRAELEKDKPRLLEEAREALRQELKNQEAPKISEEVIREKRRLDVASSTTIPVQVDNEVLNYIRNFKLM